MPDERSPWKSRGPRPPRDDAGGRRPAHGARVPGGTREENRDAPRPPQEGDIGHQLAREHRHAEVRLYGLNAVQAVFARRPQSIRKLYLAGERVPQLQPLLKWCVSHRVGYRVVEDVDLQKLAASSHHEGVVADVLREEPRALTTWLRELPEGPQCALWLDGVGNPHNLGAILRSAAHFGVGAILLPKHSTLALSGAAARVAEGGAESVPFVRLGREDNAIAQLHGAGFTLAATVVRGGTDVFRQQLPQRLVYVMGAEGEGMDASLVESCDLRVSIPGSGAVESLNVAAATAVLLAEWIRQRG
jgi:RNA methyltransferase, TrmH family